MFDEPEENPNEQVIDPKQRAQDKADEFRMHAELCAVFEGCRKFDAGVRPGLTADVARDCQKAMATLEKHRLANTPVVGPEHATEAARVLDLYRSAGLTTNDYHVYRRPGEAMIVRWIEAEEVEAFYERLQAHFDAALNAFREDERQALAWRQDDATAAYLEALDAIDLRMAERYLRGFISEHRVYVLSTHTSDEMNIAHLCDVIMNVPSADVVGEAAAPPEDGATEQDLAWFFKLFSLRGCRAGVEQMCFFTFLQKADDFAW